MKRLKCSILCVGMICNILFTGCSTEIKPDSKEEGVSSDFFKEEQWNSRSSTTEEQAKRQELSEEEQVSKWRLSTRIINPVLL